MTFIVNVLLACIFLYCAAVLGCLQVQYVLVDRVSYLLWHGFSSETP